MTELEAIEILKTKYYIIPREKKPDNIMEVTISKVCSDFEIKTTDLLVPKRTAEKITIVRYIVAYLLFYKYNMTQGKIAKKLQRDRSTINFGIKHTLKDLFSIKYKIDNINVLEYVENFSLENS